MKQFLLRIILGATILLPQTALAQVGSLFPTTTGLSTAPLEGAIINVINAILAFLFIIALIVIIWGVGLVFWSGEAETGRKAIFGGIIGLVIVLIAFSIVNFVVTTIT